MLGLALVVGQEAAQKAAKHPLESRPCAAWAWLPQPLQRASRWLPLQLARASAWPRPCSSLKLHGVLLLFAGHASGSLALL